MLTCLKLKNSQNFLNLLEINFRKTYKPTKSFKLVLDKMKNKNGKKEVRKSDIDTPPKREFKCSECPKIYKLEGFLKRHLQKHKTDNSCPLPPGRRYTRARTQCESSQSQSVPLLRQRGRSECTSPGRPVSKTPDFYRNLRGEFVCGCGFATLTVKSLMKHQYRHHNVPLLYNCTECSKFFTSA